MPLIQTVVVRLPGSGVRVSPVRRIWPWGRSTSSSRAVVTTSPRAVRQVVGVPSASCSVEPGVGGEVEHPQVVRGQRDAGQDGRGGQHRGRAVGQRVVVGPPPRRAAPAAGRRRARTAVSTWRTSSGPVAAGWSGRTRPKNPVRCVAPGASTTASSCTAARACSCCSRVEGRSGRSSPDHTRPARGPLDQLEHVGGPADAAAQRAHDDPRAPARRACSAARPAPPRGRRCRPGSGRGTG